MRTEDLNRFEGLARQLSFGHRLDPSEVREVLSATDITAAELRTRAQFLRDRRAAFAEARKVTVDPEHRPVLGVDEGLAILMAPLILLTLFFAALASTIASLT